MCASRASISIGIVGGAPSGTMALERLVAELAANPLDRPVEIHCFNRTSRFGSGDVFDPDQDDFLLTHVSMASFDMWSREGSPAVVPWAPSLYEWILANEPDAESELDPTKHAPRARAGRYLEAGFAKIAHCLPAGVTLHCHVGNVVDLEPDGRQYRVVYEPAGDNPVAQSDERKPKKAPCRKIPCRKVLLATGHPQPKPSPRESDWISYTQWHPGSAFIPTVYPVSRQLAETAIAARSTVAIKGMSLTFIDAVLALTEGRGGRFEPQSSGELRYRPSGREPARILPFSRSGLPARPRASDITRCRHEPVFCTAAAMAALDGGPRGKIDFIAQVWPLFELDMEWAYYRVWMQGGEDEQRLKACGNDVQAFRDLISSFLQRHPAVPPFDVNAILDPIGPRSFENAGRFRQFVKSHLRRENRKSRRGGAVDAEKAAVEAWRSCRVEMLDGLAFGGLTPESHRALHTQIWPRMLQMVFGPPLCSMKKLVALVEHGIVDFAVALAPDVSFCDRLGGFRLQCGRTQTQTVADFLVDARVQSFSLDNEASELYGNLRRRGHVRALKNEMPGQEPFVPGGLEIAPGSRSVVQADGCVHPDLSALGVPIHGCVYDDISPLQAERNHPAGVWARRIVDELRREHSPIATAGKAVDPPIRASL